MKIKLSQVIKLIEGKTNKKVVLQKPCLKESVFEDQSVIKAIQAYAKQLDLKLIGKPNFYYNNEANWSFASYSVFRGNWHIATCSNKADANQIIKTHEKLDIKEPYEYKVVESNSAVYFKNGNLKIIVE